MRHLYRCVVLGLLILSTAAAAQTPEEERTIQLYNFVTQSQTEVDPATLTAEQGEDFLPQIDEIQAIYAHYLGTGNAPWNALHRTFHDTLVALQEAPTEVPVEPDQKGDHD